MKIIKAEINNYKKSIEVYTNFLESEDENSVHLDVFLDYNRDPVKTSPSQLARLLDQTNNKKSVDKMLELLAVLGVSVRPHFEQAS